jgi:hypothetical protein
MRKGGLIFTISQQRLPLQASIFQNLLEKYLRCPASGSGSRGWILPFILQLAGKYFGLGRQADWAAALETSAAALETKKPPGRNRRVC